MINFTFNQSTSFEVPHRKTLAIRLPLAFWNIALIAIAAILCVWYLVQVNVTMSNNYQIRDARTRLSAAEMVTRSSQTKLTELETVGNLTAQAQAIGMVPVGSVEYVTRQVNEVALR